MNFNESNTVEAYIRDRLSRGARMSPAGMGVSEARSAQPSDIGFQPEATEGERRKQGASAASWVYALPSDVPRQSQDVLVEAWVRDALIRLNPQIAAQPDRADDVLYKLRAIIMGVRSDGLVKANEEFAAWLTGERSMPFGKNGEHVTIRLLDFLDMARNEFVVTTQYTYRAGATEKRADLVLLVNGIPLVVIEAKTPVRASQSWLDAAVQLHEDYERNIPELFVPNLLSVATEGKELRYGSIGLPVELWGPWRIAADCATPSLQEVAKGVDSLLRPHVLLDLLANFTCYATDKKKRRMKIVARYQQYDGANKIVERVVAGHPKKGLIWHFQGSGKSLLMLFAARKLRLHPALKNPTVIIVVDRIDLDTQISSTFYAADMPNMLKIESQEELRRILMQDVRKIMITTIFKFGGSQSQAPSPPAPLPEGEGSPCNGDLNYRGGFQFSGLADRARELRKKGTAAEDLFWELVRDRRFMDLKFRRQHQIGDYIVDFYCDEARLVIELDGPVHDDRKDADAKRDAYLRGVGLTVLRIRNDDFIEDAEVTLQLIAGNLPSPLGRGDGGEGRPGQSAALSIRHNIIVLVDEAHRTQEGDLGRKMREALPNAFLFGLTGTPINRADRNTFYSFGAEEDGAGYMSKYGFEESIRDGATKPLHFEPRLLELHIDKAGIDEAFKELTGKLSDLDRDELAQTAAKMAVLVKSPERVEKICADIARHFQVKVAPHGFGAQVVTFDRASCVLYKKALDQHLPPEVSDVVMSVKSGESEYAEYDRNRDAEEKLLDRFRDPADPLKMLIVTSKLLTGFDAPILQAMYLDKPLRDHTLLQAICRTNRPYGETKTHGLIVDYLGVFDDVAQAIQFDEEGITRVVKNISELKSQLPGAVQKCLAYFAGVDRTLTGYEGLIAAQSCLPNNETRDRFAADYSYLSRLWEAISPDSVLTQYEVDYRWLSQVYDSVKPSSGGGRLLWHALGAKTIELIHQHVHIDAIRDDLETLVLDADLLEAVLGSPDPNKKSKEIEIKVSRWLRKRLHDPRFKELGERLEELKARHEQGLLTSVEFLKELLNLARDVVTAERAEPPAEREEQGKAALTDLFEASKNEETPIIVERVVNDIDEIVRYVRFDGWQSTFAGEREVKLALRKTLFKYRLHQDQDLFDKAYGYIREYY